MPHESSGLTVIELARLVVQMRAVQKRFFAGDRSSATIAEAKAKERRVDEATRQVLTGQRQGSLFGGEASRA